MHFVHFRRDITSDYEIVILTFITSAFSGYEICNLIVLTNSMNVIHANETTQLYFHAFIRFEMRRRRYKGLRRSISDWNLNQIKTSHFMFLSWFYSKKTKIMISYFGLKFNRKPTLIFTSLAVQTFSASVQLRWISKIANSLAEAKNFVAWIG